MRRIVSSRIEAEAASPLTAVLSIAPAGPDVEAPVAVTLDGRELDVREVVESNGNRLHLVDVTAPGRLVATCAATIDGQREPAPVSEVEAIRYLRPSRYCESDRLTPTARAEFSGLQGMALLDAVSSWVGQHLAYVAGSSRPTDGAVNTLLDRRGVCRDFAHLCIALLRACDVPARLVSVYAPGLAPMDFHAVAEVLVDDRWLVVDATCLAPRSAMVRIATGRDASDTAFLTNIGGNLLLTGIEVVAYCEGALPNDDLTAAVALG